MLTTICAFICTVRFREPCATSNCNLSMIQTSFRYIIRHLCS